MDNNEPKHKPSTPPSGWWKAPATLATDTAFLRVDNEVRLASVGMFVALVGWCVQHQAGEGWIPRAAVIYGQVCAAPPEQLTSAVDGLIVAGLLVEAKKEGMDGYIVAGAVKAVSERFARQKSGQEGGKANADRIAEQQRKNQKPKRIDPNEPVDWSRETGEL